ncbi:PREDICTED: secretoglobin family 2B member 2-like [Capra hircus]|uniref:secretoglobin family 2B member 2-like n=1 Tax=Capra hircus TaxID=9925 RepID=UPI0006B1324B|nr:PREDICTED: secretoglobin family 2B member 2-like [Capra hircus]
MPQKPCPEQSTPAAAMMKGALLVLALLVTRELTFKTTEAEACPVFYGGVAALLLGSKTLLNSTLDLVDTTDEEKAAFGKAQDCFNEAGFDAKLKIVELVGSIIFDKDCSGYQVSTVVNSLFGIILSAVSLVK